MLSPGEEQQRLGLGIFLRNTVSQKMITTYYSNDKTGLAEFADAIRIFLDRGSPWTMTIKPVKSGGFYVHTAIGESYLGTDENSEQASYRQHLNTLRETTQAG